MKISDLIKSWFKKEDPSRKNSNQDISSFTDLNSRYHNKMKGKLEKRLKEEPNKRQEGRLKE